MTLREKIAPFLREHTEFFVSLVEKGGEDTVFEGVRVLDDPCFFVQGTLVENAIYLYIDYAKANDPRAEHILGLIHTFLGYLAPNPCKTWGKFALLRAFAKLKEADLLDRLDPADIALVNEKTEYTEFFDKSTVTLIGYATNYYHVAMVCAGLREKIGFDEPGMCDKILARLTDIMKNASSEGWMDEQPPWGRFDRYSIVVSSELSDSIERCGKPFPSFFAENLRKAADLTLFTANRRGDGINYGRSLSVHGDACSAEILGSALSRGLIPDGQKSLALALIHACTDKVLSKWYDKSRRSFNLWWDGRATNNYRGVERVLELNLDMANHLRELLYNVTLAGLDNAEPTDCIPSPAEWTVREEVFDRREDSIAEAVVLRRGDDLVMLPFVGGGRLMERGGYLPFPACLEKVEANPETLLPFFAPEFLLKNGKKLRPGQFYTDVGVTPIPGGVRAVAKGNLLESVECYPVKTDFHFVITADFCGDNIRVSYCTDLADAEAVLYLGELSCEIAPIGTDKIEPFDLQNDDCRTPAGRYRKAIRCVFCGGEAAYSLSLLPN